jgi:signal peptidase I
VIVLVPPEPDQTTQFYVKRIVGLPGEKVQVKSGKVVIYNATYPFGFMLDESYLPADERTEGSSSEPVPVPNGSYYVLGDNREHSNDSRYWGVLPRRNIVGQVGEHLWPIHAAPER